MAKKYLKILLCIFTLTVISCMTAYASGEQVTLYRVDDCVMQDRVFSVYGDSIPVSNIKAFVKSNSVSETELDIVAVDDEGTYIQMLFPDDVANGTYSLWLETSDGAVLSNELYINKSRPLWMSENTISQGNVVLISGRNMDASEWGGTRNSSVKLKSKTDSTEYIATVTEVTPFSLKFTIDDTVPQGEYSVMTTNDGYLWSELDNGDTLTVKETSTDPLNLGVAWADEFNWSREINVTDFLYGADGTDTDSDTTAFNDAFKAASLLGGGVIYVPAGTYYIDDTITMPPNTILKGDGDSTILVWRPDTTNITPATRKNMIDGSANAKDREGKQGIANIKLTMADGVSNDYLPINFIALGSTSNREDVNERNAHYGFLKNVTISYSDATPTKSIDNGDGTITSVSQNRGEVYIGWGDHFLVDGCSFTGWDAVIRGSHIRKYLTIKNTVSDTMIGCFYIYSQYTWYDNCDFTRMPYNTSSKTDVATQGVYTRSDCHIENCTVTNTGNKNGDGEVLAAESYLGGTKMYGSIVSADGLTVTVNPKTKADGTVLGESFGAGENAWNLDKRVSADWAIVIVDGKGTGQYRKVTAMDETAKTVTIDRAWDIIPDATSRFSIVMPLNNITFYKNTLKNCGYSLLFYGPTLDCVIADNTMEDGVGAQLWVIHKIQYDTTSMDCRIYMGYFNRFCRNNITGVSWKTNTATISCMTRLECITEKDTFGRVIIGFTASDNTVKGDGRTADEILNDRDTELGGTVPYVNGIVIGSSISAKTSTETPLIECVVVENNRIENSINGISIGPVSYDLTSNDTYMTEKHFYPVKNASVRNNAFNNVETKFSEYGKNLTVSTELSAVGGTVEGTATAVQYFDYAIDGNYVYAGSKQRGIDIWDISDMSNPKMLTQPDVFKITCLIDTDQAIIVNDNDLFVAVSGNKIIRYDISDPTSPSKVAEYGAVTPQSLEIIDGYLYSAGKTYVTAISLATGTATNYSVAKLDSEMKRALCVRDVNGKLAVCGTDTGVVLLNPDGKGGLTVDKVIKNDAIKLVENRFMEFNDGKLLVGTTGNTQQIFSIDISSDTISEIISGSASGQNLISAKYMGKMLVVGTRAGIEIYDMRGETPSLKASSSCGQSFNLKARDNIIFSAHRQGGIGAYEINNQGIFTENIIITPKDSTFDYLNIGYEIQDGKITYTLKNNSTEVLKGEMIVATYKDGRYVDMESQSVEIQGFGKKSYPFDLAVNEGETVKAFLWRSLENQMPMTECN